MMSYTCRKAFGSPQPPIGTTWQSVSTRRSAINLFEDEWEPVLLVKHARYSHETQKGSTGDHVWLARHIRWIQASPIKTYYFECQRTAYRHVASLLPHTFFLSQGATNFSEWCNSERMIFSRTLHNSFTSRKKQLTPPNVIRVHNNHRQIEIT